MAVFLDENGIARHHAFKSLGVAIEDVALAVRAYEKAVERKAGQALPNLTG